MALRRGFHLNLRAFFGLLMLCGICQAQNVSEHERRAEEAFRKNFSISERVPLHVVPRPDLEETLLLTLQAGHGLQRLKVPRVSFYEITVGVFKFCGEEIQSETFQLDDESHGLIAFAPNGKQFPLKGFEGAANSFSELANNVGLSARDSEEAIGILDLYFKLVGDPASILADDMNLESVALADFRLECVAKNRKAAYRAWRKAIPKGLWSVLEPPQAHPLGEEFLVEFYRYSQLDVYRETVVVSRNGRVDSRARTKVYAASDKIRKLCEGTAR